MVTLRKKGEEVRQYILENIENNPKGLVTLASQKFGITRQAIYKHVRNLITQGDLIRTRNGHYDLRPQEKWSQDFIIDNNTSEDVLWRNQIQVNIGQLPDNTIAIWHYGFTEMFNNVIDHSEGRIAVIEITKNAYSTEMVIVDDGIGIFNKIKSAMGLLDERHAVLELTKGKLTTDPDRHSGEGIFFSSRMFDTFSIMSGEVYLSHTYGKDEDWILQTRKNQPGTYISMQLKNNTSRTTKEIFDKFTSDDEYGFTKTVIPVRLAQYGNERLVSRSQAKRLLERVDRFKIVILDFFEVETIGQAFADEVFRVFVKQHPEIKIIPFNANEMVSQLIKRAELGADNEVESLKLPM